MIEFKAREPQPNLEAIVNRATHACGEVFLVLETVKAHHRDGSPRVVAPRGTFRSNRRAEREVSSAPSIMQRMGTGCQVRSETQTLNTQHRLAGMIAGRRWFRCGPSNPRRRLVCAGRARFNVTRLSCGLTEPQLLRPERVYSPFKTFIASRRAAGAMSLNRRLKTRLELTMGDARSHP
jgi:hypothetical protein